MGIDNIKNRMLVLEQALEEHRRAWVKGSPAMRQHISQVAKPKAKELRTLKKNLEKYGAVQERII